jgi:peptide/nickel transport system substrate-binding protein
MLRARTILLAASAAVAVSCATAEAQTRTPRDALVMAWNIDAILTMDPAQIGEVVTDEIVNNVCDQLIAFEPDDSNKLLPGLAERWDISEDGKTYTFHLRRGLKHPSGNPVTAEDAAWSIRRVMWLGFGNAATLGQWGLSADTIEQQVRTLDEHTLQVTVPEAWPPSLFLSVFAGRQGIVLDRKAIEPHFGTRTDGKPDHGNAWLRTNLACVGPYRLTRWTASDTVILERNAGHWRGEAPMRRVIIRHIPESAAQRLLLERGDVDVARDLNGEDSAGVDAHANLRLLSALRQQLWYLTANMEDPIAGNADVRMALRWLIDYRGLERTVMRYAGRAWNSFAPQGAFGALPPEEGVPFALDLDKARAHLAKAGHPNGFTIRLIHGSGFPYPDIVQHLQGNAAKVGIRIELEQMAYSQVISRTRDKNFALAISAWTPGYEDADANAIRHIYNPDPRPEAKQTMYLSWRAGYYDPSMNEAVMAARRERDPEQRILMYHALQRRFMQEGPFIYAFQQVRLLAVGPALKDIKQSARRVAYATAVK